MQFSDIKINEILNFEELEKIFRHFSVTTGLDVSLYDSGGVLLLHRFKEKSSLCRIAGNCAVCRENIIYGGEKAKQLGEPYIFSCGCGLIMCSSPVVYMGQLIGSVVCGPVMLWDADEYAKEELEKNFKAIDIDCNIDLNSVMQLSCVNMTSACQILYILVNYLCREYEKIGEQKIEISRQKELISALSADKQIQNTYPIDLEKKLILYVQLGEKSRAKEVINRFLGKIFLYADGNMDIIKAKLYEFTAFLSRAAVEAGAPLSDMISSIKNSASLLSEKIEFQDVCSVTIEILYDFIDIVYKNRENRQGNRHLIAAADYIAKNFKENITLDSVSKNIFVSPYYLSHLFRDELGITFSDYVNSKRIEEAKRLLGEKYYDTETLCEMVGFNNTNYFIKIFKKYTGATPSKYKKA
jgi:two-component system response regulator YesN